MRGGVYIVTYEQKNTTHRCFLIQGGGCVLVGTGGNVNIELGPKKIVN